MTLRRALSVAVAAVATLGVMLALHLTTSASEGSAAARLTGVTWRGAESSLIVVFTDTTVRISDGCSSNRREVSISDGVMENRQDAGPHRGLHRTT